MFEPAKLAMLVPFLLWCWLMMMVVHESGHVLGALVSGGTVKEVVFHPFTISRTDVFPNPNPQLVAWSGPVFGAFVPILVWFLGSFAKIKCIHLLRFFAGFCLVANGSYLAVGAFESIGDAGELLRHGSQIWQLVLFGLTVIPIGFLLWHGQGAEFGIGQTKGSPETNDFYISIVLFTITFIAMLLLG